MAEAEATRLVGAARDRIDADRIARRELQDLLGEARRPWLGTTLSEPDLEGALDELAELAMAGYDLLRVEVPMGRELADRLHDAGVDVPEWHPRDRSGRSSGSAASAIAAAEGDGTELAPTGSQRALSRLRRVADGVAAERRGYVRIATAIPPLGVPEGAVVAAFERVDLVEADPMAEIVVGGVHPDRSLADHAFARRLHRRADTLVSIGAGAARRGPRPRLGRAGRRRDPQRPRARAPARRGRPGPGRTASRPTGIVVGAYPAWLAEESMATGTDHGRGRGPSGPVSGLHRALRRARRPGRRLAGGHRLAIDRGRPGPGPATRRSSCGASTATGDEPPGRAGPRPPSRPSWRPRRRRPI